MVDLLPLCCPIASPIASKMSDCSPPTQQDPQLVWGMVEVAVTELEAAQPAKIVEGKQLSSLVAMAGLVSVCCQDGPPPGAEGVSSEQRLANINASLLLHLERVLAARRRPRDMSKVPAWATTWLLCCASDSQCQSLTVPLSAGQPACQCPAAA